MNRTARRLIRNGSITLCFSACYMARCFIVIHSLLGAIIAIHGEWE